MEYALSRGLAIQLILLWST